MAATIPHVIFILSDQHRADVIGAAGDPIVRTPHLDRLMREGVSLSNCYCGSPLCVPSRMSMLTSRLPNQTGVFANSQALGSDQPTMAHGMAAAGYETVLCGRMHFVGMDQWHGYEKRLVGDLTATMPDAVPLDYGSYHVGTGQTARGAKLAGPGRSFVMAYDQDVTAGAIQYLHDRSDQRPLFMTVGYYGPHCPFICPRDLFAYYWDRLAAVTAPAEVYDAHHPAMRAWMDRRDLRTVTRDDVRVARAAYYGLVELMDRHVGRILTAVDETLGLDNTLIVYGSDHGEMMGEHGLFWKSNFFDGSVRVPLIVRQPGVMEGGRTITAPTTLLDLAPTLLEHGGGPSLPGAQGESLIPVLRGVAEAALDREIVSMMVDRDKYASAMLRYRQWKLVSHHNSDPPQLYDMVADPGETRDLGGDPRWRDVRDDLQRRLHRWWDADQALACVRHVAHQYQLVRDANRASRIQPTGQWMPSVTMNEIEPWP